MRTTTKFYTCPVMESLFYQLVFRKYPGNEICGIWWWKMRSLQKSLSPFFLWQTFSFTPFLHVPSLSPPSQIHQGAPQGACLCISICMSVNRGPQSCKAPPLHMQTPMKILSIVLYFIVITQHMFCSICRIKLSSGPC